MADIVLRAAVFLIIVALGYVLKRLGMFGKTDFRIVSKIVMNVTLPGAVVAAFVTAARDPSLFVIVPLGIAANLLAFLTAFVFSRRMDRTERIFYMMNVPGYNIGCATLPFAQGFLGAAGVVATCMFDTGNAVMVAGGTYAITSAAIGERSEPVVKTIVKKLFSSVLFDTYFVVFLMMVFQIRIPTPVARLSETIGAANGFLAMFMIGMMLEFPENMPQLLRAVRTLLLRYGLAIVLSLACYFLLPFDLMIRQAVVLALFSPVSTIAPVYTDKLGGDAALAGMTNSVSIPISLLIMTGLLIAFGG
ncbi:AEC family transporter [Beduinella massiliensis]|uniref:AEC family transporter n=1 Tax=Beduinella massiliensis TaxID=1852363 RepID=UPI000C84D908